MSAVKEGQVGLAVLGSMSSAELESIWRRHLGGSPPGGLPKALCARMLAYRLQVQRFGDLPKSAVKFLAGITADLAAGKDPDVPYPEDRRLKAGAVLVREYGGVQHRVMVLEEGYAWNGQTFASLSTVAKAITGTNWNGQRFFGLDRKCKAGGAS
jgi:hypothetical protein